MLTEVEKDSFLGGIKWPETMWPFRPDFLRSVPSELWPDQAALNNLRYPWKLLTLLRDVMRERVTGDKISGRVNIMENIVIRSPVWIEEGVTIYPFSLIEGPTFLGKNTLVGSFTQIRESFIGTNCLVGERTSIIRSIVGRRCFFHINYLGDSLFDEDVDVGGGVGTANRTIKHAIVKSVIEGVELATGMRKLGALVGRGVKFGSRCSLMPGVKIGAGCILGSGVRVYKDLPDNSRCRVIQELQILSGDL